MPMAFLPSVYSIQPYPQLGKFLDYMRSHADLLAGGVFDPKNIPRVLDPSKLGAEAHAKKGYAVLPRFLDSKQFRLNVGRGVRAGDKNTAVRTPLVVNLVERFL